MSCLQEVFYSATKHDGDGVGGVGVVDLVHGSLHDSAEQVQDGGGVILSSWSYAIYCRWNKNCCYIFS